MHRVTMVGTLALLLSLGSAAPALAGHEGGPLLHQAAWDQGGPPPHARGWGPGGRPKGWRANDPRWQRDGWNQPGWHAEYFYVDDPRYRPRTLGRDEPIWRGYDDRYYCRRSDGTTGLIVGGLAGGVLGNVLAPGGSKLLGSVIGGTLGAVVGQSLDRNRVVCR